MKVKRNKDRFKSKYLDLDIKNMSDEEFEKISKSVYSSIAIRCGSGGILLILCFIALVLCGKYLW